MKFVNLAPRYQYNGKRRGPLHVRPDEEPDVTFVIVREIENGCAFCNQRGHSHRFCPSAETILHG